MWQVTYLTGSSSLIVRQSWTVMRGLAARAWNSQVAHLVCFCLLDDHSTIVKAPLALRLVVAGVQIRLHLAACGDVDAVVR